SLYYDLHDKLGANVPKPNLEEVKNQIFALTDCIDNELIISCHDIADGGVVSTLAEMTFGNEIGFDVEILGELSNEKLLFSETGGFVLEVDPKNVNGVKSVFSKYNLDVPEIGKTTSHQSLVINNAIINVSVRKAKEAWTNGLREKL
ncbi:MAG TPA: phosphoribosylformylglycinamidine synthase subunit PurL, partial [Candidatus Marinimicrobia bacterium]|nr:phosphoribosylformylglycinamidine synthase subunit PurL [Candidatus Neomarinimicrobiota bacterium]